MGMPSRFTREFRAAEDITRTTAILATFMRVTLSL